MSQPAEPSVPPRGEYGVDAPYVPLAFALAALVMIAFGGWTLAHGTVGRALPWFVGAAWFALSGASYLYTTRAGKFRVWADLLDWLALRGDERVLDVGCGRGAVLVQAAARVPSGRAVGVDLWRSVDQSGNEPEATRRNARAAGVEARIELATGDMRELPFPDGSFDVVVSSLAIHNVPDADGRARAVDEIWRVLKPGGRVLLADIGRTPEYEARLRAAGAQDLSRRSLGVRMWYGGPYAATTLVSARKPAV